MLLSARKAKTASVLPYAPAPPSLVPIGPISVQNGLVSGTERGGLRYRCGRNPGGHAADLPRARARTPVSCLETHYAATRCA
eukprot:1138771-Rhodomonas_salina.1